MISLTLDERWAFLSRIPEELGKPRAGNLLRADGRPTFLGALDELVHLKFDAKSHPHNQNVVLLCLAITFGLEEHQDDLLVADTLVGAAPFRLRHSVAVGQLVRLFNLTPTDDERTKE